MPMMKRLKLIETEQQNILGEKQKLGKMNKKIKNDKMS